jgi:hypothetical protein
VFKNNRHTHYYLILLLFIGFICQPESGMAVISGECSDCHTMHNSQGGTAMATYKYTGEADGPYPNLLVGTCLGCHAQNTGNNIEDMSGNAVPQVYHTNSTDLAAGNFRYVDTNGDNYGHNVIDIFGVNSDGTLDVAPGQIPGHGTGILNDTHLTCAGAVGCHGLRVNTLAYGSYGHTGIVALDGAHHGNEDGQLTSATTVANSYRFLLQVKGLENPTATAADKWQNKDSSSHNEYFGQASPKVLGCSGAANASCHTGGTYLLPVAPPSFTISEFCGTCHANFHSLAGWSFSGNPVDGIGTSASSPFIRHPTDIVIPDSGEYAVALRSYNTVAPLGRTTVPASASSAASTTDVVTCLSCHYSHAGPYPDLLRWDYLNKCETQTSYTENDCGCFVCHTTKDG